MNKQARQRAPKSGANMETAPKRRRRYSDDEKAAAIALYDFNSNLDKPLAVTSKALQIPDSTLQRWTDGEAVSENAQALREEKKKSIDELCEEYARQALSKLIPNLDDIKPRDFASIGIAIDKMLLLRGQPTQITETRNDAALREKAEALLAQILPEYGGDRAAALAVFREHAPTLSAYVN